MDIARHASKYAEWQEIYNWDTCKTNREEYGKFLCSFLTSTDDSLVVNMNGSWGTGKTELLRRLYVELAEQKHAVVYIDAWQSDFSNDALAVVCSEFLIQLGYIFESNGDTKKNERFEEAKDKIKLLKTALNTCLKLVQGYGLATGDVTTAALATGANVSLEAIDKATSLASKPQNNSVTASNVELLERVQENHLARISAMADIKNQITFLAELMHEIYGLNNKIIVLVDELDRCRPTYAVEMLEVIKHFFETKGCAFLVATDTEALQHSISAIYGTNFKAESYLKRFFNRKIRLSDISELDYLKSKKLDFNKYTNSGLLLYPFKDNQEGNVGFFAELFSGNNFKLRDIEQALQQFFASLDYIAKTKNETEHVINTIVLMTGITENMRELPDFQSRSSNLLKTHTSVGYNGKFVGYSMNEVINISLELVTKTMSKEVCTGSGGRTIHQVPQECLHLQSHVFPNIHNSSYELKNLRDIIALYQSYQYKYWLWDDYKNIIDLSGNIE
jgi:Cdc6-like AAA superfamily ATPase